MSGRSLQLLKHLRVVWCMVETFCFSGLHYGWPSLVYVLKDEGFFADGCEIQNKTLGSEREYKVCDRQEEQLTLLYSVANGFAIVPFYLCGTFISRFGPIKTRIVWTGMFALGCSLMIVSSPDIPWVACAGLTLLAGGGVVFLLTNIQISNLYTTGSYLVIALMNGCYDSSSAILLFVKFAYEAGIRRRISFAVILGFSMITFINTFVKSNLTVPKDVQEDSEEPNNETKDDSDNMCSRNGLSTLLTGDQSCTFRNTYKAYVCNRMFISHMSWFTAMAMNLGYSITTSNIYIREVSDSGTISESSLTNFISLALMIGIVPAIIAGIFLERFKYRIKGSVFTRDMKTCIIAFITTSGLSASLAVLSMFHEETVAYISFIILPIFRAFLYNITFAYILKAFPSRAFGALSAVICALACITFLLQGALIEWQHAHRNAEFHIRIALLVSSVISIHHPLMLLMTIRRTDKEVNESVETSHEHDNWGQFSLSE